MIHAGFSELRKAFFVHGDVNIEENPASSHLLLFYTVESGLKAVYLRRNRFGSTKQIVDSKIVATHDLFLLAKILKLPAQITGRQNNFKLKRDGSPHPIGDAHQAWRYHIVIELDDERKIVKWLQDLKEWLRERL